MATVVNDGYIAEGHKAVKTFPKNGFTVATVDVTYDYATEKWSASAELPAFELYCGFKVTYCDENGSTRFYVPAGSGLPAYEGNTERSDGLFLGWCDNRGNWVEPGDQSVLVNSDMTITATFLPYPDTEENSNVPGQLFRFVCQSDFDDWHHPAISMDAPTRAGVKPAFGDIAVEDAEQMLPAAVFPGDRPDIRRPAPGSEHPAVQPYFRAGEIRIEHEGKPRLFRNPDGSRQGERTGIIGNPSEGLAGNLLIAARRDDTVSFTAEITRQPY